jgi:hypothetical protein
MIFLVNTDSLHTCAFLIIVWRTQPQRSLLFALPVCGAHPMWRGVVSLLCIWSTNSIFQPQRSLLFALPVCGAHPIWRGVVLLLCIWSTNSIFQPQKLVAVPNELPFLLLFFFFFLFFFGLKKESLNPLQLLNPLQWWCQRDEWFGGIVSFEVHI